ncbi:UvrD-helicase domain-containing protein [Nocardioides convexus]|uniref:UvrD-helicase domain-containing protein n=1 Tax=Nocardioides convexus TaxID=2712224 RepID=UPI002418BABA|nr:UvrD-helicase domain-containing protein [Nocardioides convexus]
MRERWRIVLVDEFQDTDPVQWQVFDRAFTGHATMVLIGDPKQAIYAFRGGDVTTYLTAAGTATTRQTLDVNRRSDAGLLARFQALMGGAEYRRPEDRRARGDRAPPGVAPGRRPEPRAVPGAGGAPRVLRPAGLGHAADAQGAALDRPRPGPRRPRPGHRAGRDLRRPAAATQRRRGHLLPPLRPRGGPGSAARGRRARGHRRRRQRLRDPGGGRVAGAAGGAGAAAPHAAGAGGGAHLLPRLRRRGARRRG